MLPTITELAIFRRGEREARIEAANGTKALSRSGQIVRGEKLSPMVIAVAVRYR